MALTSVEQVRLLTQDNTPGLYIVSDDEISFFLERNNNNINRTAMDTARVILLNLSMRTVPWIFSPFVLARARSNTDSRLQCSYVTQISTQF
jgi:hypothetical protein